MYHKPLNNSVFTKITVETLRLWDTRFLRLTLPVLDFIGVNYYFRTKVKGFGVHHSSRYQSDLGWGLYPNGIYNVLQYLQQFNKPIVISENGVADSRDIYRGWWISETLESIQKAKNEGVAVVGYMHWSLLDNFEWDKGYWPRFGLIEVNLETKQRTLRPSAYLYQEYIRKLNW
jgi:beta-glucosidase